MYLQVFFTLHLLLFLSIISGFFFKYILGGFVSKKNLRGGISKIEKNMIPILIWEFWKPRGCNAFSKLSKFKIRTIIESCVKSSNLVLYDALGWLKLWKGRKVRDRVKYSKCLRSEILQNLTVHNWNCGLNSNDWNMVLKLTIYGWHIGEIYAKFGSYMADILLKKNQCNT